MLLGDYRFEFDSRDDLMDLFNEKAKMLNQRALTDALMAHGYSKDKFLNWIDRYSNFLQKNKDVIHEILDSWTEPDIMLPTGVEEPEINKPAASSSTADNSDLDGDFNSVFGDGGEETDTDLFGVQSNAKTASAKIDASEVIKRIKDFDFTL